MQYQAGVAFETLMVHTECQATDGPYTVVPFDVEDLPRSSRIALDAEVTVKKGHRDVGRDKDLKIIVRLENSSSFILSS